MKIKRKGRNGDVGGLREGKKLNEDARNKGTK
jgi:hypothetical protein